MIYLFSIAHETYMFGGDYYFYENNKIFCIVDDEIYLLEYDNEEYVFQFYSVEDCDSEFIIPKINYQTETLGKYDDIVSYNNRFKAILENEIFNKILDKI